MTISIDNITRDDIVNLFSMEGGGFDYWCNLDYEPKDYKEAKAEMIENGVPKSFGDKYCYEEVLAYMVDSGRTVYAYDFEEDMHYPLTKDKLLTGFKLNAENRPNDAVLDDGDAITGDCILQYAVFGDIVYG